jgi:O-antigen ligase
MLYVYKSMSKPVQNEWRNEAVFITFLLMLITLFFSRALLSISMVLFLAVSLLHRNLFYQFVRFAKNYFLVGISLLFLIPFVSGLWSDDKKEWIEVVRIKLPLIVFPVACAGYWKLRELRWVQLAVVFLGIVLGGVCWSLFHYFNDMRSIHEGYLKSKTIVTILENDHVRFSWMVTVGVLLCLLLIRRYPVRLTRILCGSLFLIFAVYLHILSARTGLLAFYLVLFLYSSWLLVRLKKFWLTAAGLAALVALPLLSWFLLPTFQNRIRYFMYDFSHVQSNTYLPGSSDGNRFYSLRAAWDILRSHPGGVGAGDIKMEMSRWYDVHQPAILTADRIYPHSEWLVYGCTAGWAGLILFTAAMVAPFFIRGMNNRILWIALNATAAFSFVFDIGLEGQFALFVYCFSIFTWYMWLRRPVSEDLQ